MLLLLAGLCGRAAGTNYVAELGAFFKETDATYPFFDLKGIRPDWEQTKPRLMARAESCGSDTEFLGLVVESICCLRDAHMGLNNLKAPGPPLPARYYPGLSFMPATKGRVAVMAAGSEYGGKIQRGTVITKIDGKPARLVLEELAKTAWACDGPYFVSSPQRARLFTYRLPLAGKRNESHVLHYLADGAEQELKVTRHWEARGWPHTYNLPAGLKRANGSFAYAELASGAGYMYLRHVRPETVTGMREAMQSVPGAKGWVVDLRGNGGGGYDQELIEQIKALPRPVVVLIDAGCISAGETLARDLV
ncbi:MAG TPA: hypothetical protein VN673_11105, partial [Clostridia bacterium]|nr:hypothetical protein [Clostridia bacterium]